MGRLILACLLAFTLPTSAHATVQLNDSVVIDGKTYAIFQLPMNGLWRYEDEEPDGRDLVPAFEAPHSANWRGYIARFSIAHGRLYLDSIKGRIDGKDLANRDIIDRQFPIRAHWYTGAIFVSIGGYDTSSKRFRYVIEFSVERGNILATRYSDSRRIPMTWNGLEGPQQTRAATRSHAERKPE